MSWFSAGGGPGWLLWAAIEKEMEMPLPLGTKTEWGTIEMVGWTGGERYYWMVDKHECVSMIPASMVEPRVNPLTLPNNQGID